MLPAHVALEEVAHAEALARVVHRVLPVERRRVKTYNTDRQTDSSPAVSVNLSTSQNQASSSAARDAFARYTYATTKISVSYTHLTLPTIE